MSKLALEPSTVDGNSDIAYNIVIYGYPYNEDDD